MQEAVHKIDIEEEMRGSYLDYAMSVIVARALPDARDGLKPVQRRILYAMHDMGLRPGTPYKKSARIVGEVLGKYHPHGDQAVYEAMARMAQDFSLRYPLVDGQGNFGSVDGDNPAAMRYTEARLAPIAEEMLADLEKATVDFVENFDGTLREPAVLPAVLPNLLVNGASGIAVGMATNIPPHNLGEVAEALVYLIERWEEREEVTVEELMQFIQGPDFPTGGIIVGREGIINAYATGRGRVVVRAVAHIEEMRGNRHRIVVTEIPYQVNKSSLIERIAALVRSGRLDEISDLRDESDRRGISLIIELKRGTQPRKALNRLFKYTPLQTTFGVQLLALVDGEPRLLSLKRALLVFIEHRREVITRRSRFELEKAQRRAHILEGLRLALDFLDEVIALIRESPDAETARERLMARFDLTEVQAQAILDLPLRRLAALERRKLEEEYEETIRRIAYLEDLLANPRKVLHLIREEMERLKETYGDPRRTHIAVDATEAFSEEDLVPEEEVVVSITSRGYVKRVSARTYRAQGRGGRGVTGMATREEDAVAHLLTANSLDSLLFFTDRGKVYQERVYQLPDVGRQARGIPLVNVIALEPGEQVTAVVAVPGNGRRPSEDGQRYLTMVTRQGMIKRVALAEFATVRPSGLIAISLAEGDHLIWAGLTGGDQEIVVVTARGQALRFPETEARPMGRTAAGVNAIRLEPGDEVVGAAVVESPEAELLVVTAGGFGKRTPLGAYPTRGRYGKGVRTYAANQQRTGPIVAALVVRPEDEVLVITQQGIALRTKVASIPRMGRATRGGQLIRLQEGDRVASVTRIGRGGK